MKACLLLLLSVCSHILYLTSGKHLLYRQSTLLHIIFKSRNSPCLDSLQSEIFIVHAVINALFTKKNTKSDSKHSIAIVNKPLFIPFDLCADMTQIIYDLGYTLRFYSSR